MAFSVSETVTTTHTADESAGAAQEALSSLGLNPTRDGQTVTGKSGSFVMAWLLGFLSPDANMPIRVTVSVDDQGASRLVNISAVDAYPIPIKWGIMGKIRRQAQLLATEVQQKLQAQLA